MFFLYGARLSTRQALDGLRHWRLRSIVLASTYLVFPLLGLAARLLVPGVLTPVLVALCLFTRGGGGVPMATVLFPAATVGLIVLPLMLFHQIQLMVCVWLARRYATRPLAAPVPAGDNVSRTFQQPFYGDAETRQA
ncbi:MAG: bile acid:sodium symporter [Pseudonocardiaceae bacterium]